MHFENLATTLEIRKIDHNAAVKTTRTKQCLVKNVCAIRGGNHNNAIILLKPVHLHEHLIQSLLSLVVSTRKPSTALAPNSVDLVDEDNARRVLLCVCKQITHARSTHTYKHLHKFRARDRKERHSGLSSHCTRKQRLSGSWRALENNATRNLGANLRESLRFFQKLNHFRQFQLGLIAPSDLLEGRVGVWNHVHACARLSKAHRPTRPAHAAWPHSTAAGVSGEKKQPAEQDCREDERLQKCTSTRFFLYWKHSNVHLVRCELFEQVWIVGELLELVAVAIDINSEHLLPVCRERDLFHLVLHHRIKELRVPPVLKRARLRGGSSRCFHRCRRCHCRRVRCERNSRKTRNRSGHE
mmetsp:Transcript_11735/g.25389  ORF Transcript_11735/g.25389 Transcript_11735/m.25389 type:complete len:356 (+) Transcript_11735:1192-2259(+)